MGYVTTAQLTAMGLKRGVSPVRAPGNVEGERYELL
jgi:hypothetical protein